MDSRTPWTDVVAGDRWTVRVSGELDLATAPALREHLANALSRCGAALVVDLTDVTFCDSSGLGALVATHRRAQLLDRGLALRVREAGRVDRLLDLSALTDHFVVDRVPADARGRRPSGGQASKSSVTSSVTGWDWQASTNPAATSESSSA
jgi:anti-sigma B factor antagonist